MAEFVKIAKAAEIPSGSGKTFEVGDRPIAVFNCDGTFYAIDDTCPHQGGPLGEGELDGRIVSCPWHDWRWDVTTGANANNPAVKMACFPVTVEQGAIFVDLL